MKVNEAIQILKKGEETALQYDDMGYHLAFSGGKDSQVIYDLCKKAGVKFKAYFYRTTVDRPELLKFIRENYPDVIWLDPKLTMYQIILKKGMLPIRQARFCCDYIKESHGINQVVITGIRKSESPNRRKRKIIESFCIKGQDKIILNPIIDWTNIDVYKYLEHEKIQLCELYKNHRRIGCVGCPMSPKTMRQDFKELPNYKKAYTTTVKKLMDKGKYPNFDKAEDVIEWWTSGKSVKQYKANKNQLKLNL